MKKSDILGIAFTNFGRRKTRSILSVLGVVIGTASIVVMMSLGIAQSEMLNKQLDQIGNLTTIEVHPGWDEKTGQQKGSLNDETVAQLQGLEHVTFVSPELRLSGKIVSGKFQNYADIIGLAPGAMAALKMVPEQGVLLDQYSEKSSGKNVFCVYGSEVPYQFYNPKDPYGGYDNGNAQYDDMGNLISRDPPRVDVMDETTRVKFTFDWSYGEPNMGDTGSSPQKRATLYNLKATGVLKYDNGNTGYSIYIDMDTAKKLKKEQDRFNSGSGGGVVITGGRATSSAKKGEITYDGIKVLTDSLNNTMAVTKEIQELGFQAYSNAEWITSMQEQMRGTQTMLAAIGGVSLLVAAIGIANTMIMSIYERTREIGIMKVIGCYLRDIRTMFLTEAGLIGLFGGVVGIGLSYGLSWLLNFLNAHGMLNLGTMTGGMGSSINVSVVPPWLALVAILFAILIALISGFFPARRAMRLSALEAMKN